MGFLRGLTALRVLDEVVDDAVLDRDLERHGDVVLGLRDRAHIELLDAGGQHADDVLERVGEDREARAGGARELAQVLCTPGRPLARSIVQRRLHSSCACAASSSGAALQLCVRRIAALPPAGSASGDALGCACAASRLRALPPAGSASGPRD